MPIPAVFRDQVQPDDDGNLTYHPYRVEKWPLTQVYFEYGNGQRISLTDRPNPTKPGFVLQSGPDGWDMPRFDLKYDESPNLDGGMFRSVRATAREMAIPIFIYGADRRGVASLKKKLLTSVNPKNGPVRIVVREGGGSSRYIDAYYNSGLEGQESRDQAGFTWIKYVMTFRALDPYWTVTDPTKITWALKPERYWFLTTTAEDEANDPSLPAHHSFLPIRISDGIIQSELNEIEMDSDVEVWPIWEITGPLSGNVVFRNDTTGKELKFKSSFSLATEKDRLTIDTRAGRKTITYQRLEEVGGEWKVTNEENWWPKLGDNPQLWPLVPGVNLVSVLNGQAPSTTTRVSCTYYKQYFSYTG